ncbi:peptide chain release factor N(5)-glutamine methyltransferase [Wielerella bovis]|uniref:peptide chain release factor N(5)-glutamine methyltransferase n=1 Tax=Wielerella bovis TaxID=2917790 RepID=UPI002018446B|nr:peptide chain release factor N(5)-glutamine methyltransferase [Wielerella bovis]ULJ60135.1 peptide chain release factor N(5)-glutamine methyltransferase [Wielerella bovis]
MLTLQQWLNQTTLPRNEARMLLQQITGYTRAQLITHDTEILSVTQLNALNQLAQRRTQGEPMAYILGEREFYGRTFRVSPAVLIPRPETEHLLETALFRLPTHGILWDMGTGSGIIAITAALERSDATVYASDISPDALAIAQQNATILGANIQFAQGSWFAAAHAFRLPVDKVHILVSNPPYIENYDPHLTQGDLRFEPQTALTDFADGLQHIREIAHHAPDYLHENGYLLLEHGYDQATAVQHILRENGFVDVQTLPDLAGLDRVTLGQITT